MPGTFHCQGIGNSGEREGADRRRGLASRANVLGRLEHIQRTVTFVERYHSGVFYRECWSFSWIRGFSLLKMKGCKK